MVIQHEIQEFPTVAALRAVGNQPQGNDKFFCEETNLLYDYDAALATPDDGRFILALNSFSGRFQAVNGAEITKDLTVAGAQANNTTVFVILNGLGVFLPVGWYEIDIRWIYDVGATTTGAAFSFSGGAPFAAYTDFAIIPTSTTAANTRHYPSPNTAMPTTGSSRLTNNIALSYITVQVVVAGLYYPTFRSEVAGSAVTIKRGTSIKIRTLS